MTLQSRRLQDQLRGTQMRLDQQDRNTGLGVALDVVPEMTVDGVAVLSAPGSVGSWVRHNDLVIYWFIIVFASTPRPGFVFVTPPEGVQLWVPSAPLGVHIGEFELIDMVAGTITEGRLRSSPLGAQPSWKPAGTSGPSLATFVSSTSPFAMKVGDILSGSFTSRVA